jgi:hypothetical protein
MPISVSPLIFAFAESVFMAAATVTPPAPATSAIFCQRVLGSPVLGRFDSPRGAWVWLQLSLFDHRQPEKPL